MEYIPYRLDKWLKTQYRESDAAAKKAIAMVEGDLKTTISFMESHDLLHFDAHFRNILTDGRRLYFTDFGLAISTQFELSKAESDFFTLHHGYDSYETAMDLTMTSLKELPKRETHEAIFHEYATGKGANIQNPLIASVVKHYAPIARAMLDFFEQLRKDKTTPFPSEKLEKLLIHEK